MNRPDNSTQVIIYCNDPRGQLMQVSYGEYLHYWRLIGWTMQGHGTGATAKTRYKTAGRTSRVNLREGI
jgi:hypothetical protein